MTTRTKSKPARKKAAKKRAPRKSKQPKVDELQTLPQTSANKLGAVDLAIQNTGVKIRMDRSLMDADHYLSRLHTIDHELMRLSQSQAVPYVIDEATGEVCYTQEEISAAENPMVARRYLTDHEDSAIKLRLASLKMQTDINRALLNKRMPDLKAISLAGRDAGDMSPAEMFAAALVPSLLDDLPESDS